MSASGTGIIWSTIEAIRADSRLDDLSPAFPATSVTISPLFGKSGSAINSSTMSNMVATGSSSSPWIRWVRAALLPSLVIAFMTALPA